MRLYHYQTLKPNNLLKVDKFMDMEKQQLN